jgi:putative transposase
MCNPIFLLFAFLRSWFQSRLQLQAEIIALRHQVIVLRRSQKGRAHLVATDRVLWVWLSKLWSGWRSALLVVRPETVISWHRKGFRLYWGWRSRRGTAGRPPVSQEVRDLIRKMSLANPLWGAPRIHGELLKLGIEVSQATVAKYMARSRKPPSQTWRTFLNNHVKDLASLN